MAAAAGSRGTCLYNFIDRAPSVSNETFWCNERGATRSLDLRWDSGAATQIKRGRSAALGVGRWPGLLHPPITY